MSANQPTEVKPRRHPETAYRAIGEEGLVVMAGRGEVKVLNPTGLKIYSLLDGEHTAEEIARAITEEYEVTEDQALADVKSFVEELERNGMLASEGTKP